MFPIKFVTRKVMHEILIARLSIEKSVLKVEEKRFRSVAV